MPGRKKTPSTLKVLKGTDQPCRMNPDEAEPDLAIPSPPEHLSQDASVEWGRVSQELYKLGLLSRIDRSALAAYCQAYGRWCEAERMLAQKGLMVKTTNGNVIQSPLVGIANKALELMHKYLTEFGMTPAARARVQAKKPEGQGKKQGFGGL
jgi:P27 family predicted phage terminase small subunit